VYCGTIGYEYMHIQSRAQCNWIRERIETLEDTPLSKAEKAHLLDRMAYAETLETFAATKWTTTKRFGLEGCESLVAGTKTLLDTVSALGVESVVFGMPHRGRLNILANVVRKPLELIFKEFSESQIDLERYNKAQESGDWSSSGDVKYHLGTSFDRKYEDGRVLHLALVANPSHLEAVNPVVCGKVRAKQERLLGKTIGEVQKSSSDFRQHGRLQVTSAMKNVLGILIHGDAAFAGQGVVYETMILSGLSDYQTGGTVHIVCNNQVGFTTDPESARSTLYSTDIGKTFGAPIFHVNADDPEAVVKVFKLAGEYRQKWHTDVIIDLIGYRRHGHNELDQPAFTQPIMYQKIRSHPSALTLYKQKLINEGTLTKAEVDEIQAKVLDNFSGAFERAKTYVPRDDWLTSKWEGLFSPKTASLRRITGVSVDELKKIGHTLSTVPKGFVLHEGIARVMAQKADMFKTGKGIDWGTAEGLAFGSLCVEGFRVRLSGQDVERGTFSHRHAVLHEQLTGARYVPLENLGTDAAPFTVCNSPLSEFGVLGYELGYSLEAPDQLVLWEAQFGDFVNGAQIIIDQFIAAGEAKWLRQSALTMLLPHGYDGQGPEHSSCRLERFLQSSNDQEDHLPTLDSEGLPAKQIQESNYQVCNVTTPANYFHLLRRQVQRQFRKPLIVAAPKALLRHKDAVSSLEEMGPGTVFQRVIDDSPEKICAPSQVKRLVFCSGKLFYELDRVRQEKGINNIAICRIEQIAPFPHDAVAAALKKYSNAEVVWSQEECRNMGAWFFVAPRLITSNKLAQRTPFTPTYIGRPASASPAAGAKKIHDIEQAKLIRETLTL